jgi:hypothetical protein
VSWLAAAIQAIPTDRLNPSDAERLVAAIEGRWRSFDELGTWSAGQSAADQGLRCSARDSLLFARSFDGLVIAVSFDADLAGFGPLRHRDHQLEHSVAVCGSDLVQI